MVQCEPAAWTEDVAGTEVRWSLSKDGILKAVVDGKKTTAGTMRSRNGVNETLDSLLERGKERLGLGHGDVARCALNPYNPTPALLLHPTHAVAHADHTAGNGAGEDGAARDCPSEKVAVNTTLVSGELFSEDGTLLPTRFERSHPPKTQPCQEADRGSASTARGNTNWYVRRLSSHLYTLVSPCSPTRVCTADASEASRWMRSESERAATSFFYDSPHFQWTARDLLRQNSGERDQERGEGSGSERQDLLHRP